MSELVKLEDVKNAFNSLYGNEYSFAELREKLNVYDEDSANVKPVICGEWEDISHITFEPTIRCSECWVNFPMPVKDNGEYVYSNFCPHCGADMRGDK